jgi:anti-sigma-K factor RskA
MSDEMEDALRRALRPVDPDEGFADRVLARVRREPAVSSRWRQKRLWNFGAALAASAVLAVVLIHSWQNQRQRRGLEARQQLIEALRVTGEKLDIAYRGVNGESRPAPPHDAGA